MNGPHHKAVTLASSAAIACTKNTVIYTDSINISNLDGFGLAIILAGTGAVSCKIEMEQSYKAPAVENVADANYVVPTGISDIISNLAVKTQNLIALSPLRMKYIRFKITELTNVSTDTVATMFLTFTNAFATM